MRDYVIPHLRDNHWLDGREMLVSWLAVDWNQERPTAAAEESLWRSVEIRPLPDVPPAVDEYLTELRRVNVNGDAVYARFEVTGSRDFDWFATRNRWHEISFFTRLLSSSSVSNALPEVTTEATFDASVTFEWGSSLTLDGELARALVNGGAYKKFEGPPRAAKELAARACDAIFGDRFLDIEVFRCWKSWSRWFHDGAWDTTYVIIDRRDQAVSVLASTDTD
jgi:hypothetical protein